MNIDETTARVFAKLGKEKLLHEYHDIIYKLLGVVIDFINAEGVSLKLSEVKYFNPFCAKIRSCEAGNQLCRYCDIDHARTAAGSRKVLIYTCHAGFTEILVPLFDGTGRYIGGMASGQFYLKGQPRPSQKKLSDLAVSLGLDPAEISRLARHTLVLTRRQADGLVEYLETIGRLLVSAHNHLMFMEMIDAPDKIESIRKYVEANYRKRLTVEFMARKFYLSKTYFSQFFRRGTGIAFTAYVNFCRIAKAQEMLLETELSVSEIAYLCGFQSASHFARVFRSVTKSSPRHFRRNGN